MENDQLEQLGNNLRAQIQDRDLANKLSTGLDIVGVMVDVAVQLPVIDTFNKLRDGFNNYQALRLQKKLSAFLFGIRDIPQIDRQRFMEDLDSMHQLKEKSGEALMDLIVRTNNLGKIDIIINLFRAKVEGKINISDFLRLSVVLDKVSIVDLYSLKSYDLRAHSDTPGLYEESLTDALYSAGLLNISVIGGSDGTLFILNNLGKQMYLYGLSVN